MYVLGGSAGAVGQVTASVLKFDSALGGWSQVAPIPEKGYDLVACAVGSDIFVFGGDGAEHDMQDSVFRYDTLADTWSTDADIIDLTSSLAFFGLCRLPSLTFTFLGTARIW
jgi:N-acetylneuraminic acid mutarotase